MKETILYYHASKDLFEHKQESIKTELIKFISKNYDRLEETDTLDDILEAYDIIDRIISRLATHDKPEVFYGYRLI